MRQNTARPISLTPPYGGRRHRSRPGSTAGAGVSPDGALPISPAAPRLPGEASQGPWSPDPAPSAQVATSFTPAGPPSSALFLPVRGRAVPRCVPRVDLRGDNARPPPPPPAPSLTAQETARLLDGAEQTHVAKECGSKGRSGGGPTT